MINKHNSVVVMQLLILLLVTTSTAITENKYKAKFTTTHKISDNNFTLPSISSLDYDLCYVRLVTNFTLSQQSPLVIMYLFDACYDCAYQELITLNLNQTTDFFTLSTEFGYRFNFTTYDQNGKILQSDSMVYTFGEKGIYEIKIASISDHNTKGMTHEIRVLKDPINAFLPIAVAFGIAAGLSILWPIAVHYYKKSKSESLEYQLHHLESNDPKKDRMKSLDVFRGLSITIMIFVNYGGGGYWFFNHSYWNGLTVADLVFPWFVFIMGCAMPMSFNALESRGVPKKTIVIKLIRRSIILFALGMFLNNGNDLKHWRILGVLQRFGISYLVTGLIMLFVPVWRYRQVDTDPSAEPLFHSKSIQDRIASGYPRLLADILPYWIQWVVSLLLLSVWFLVTFLLPVPGCPTGYIGPGGIGSQGLHQNCTGGAARYVDLKIFGENHIYQTPTCQPIYNTASYDPEGTLGYITSVFMCFLGVQCGRTILAYKSASARLIRWTVWGIVLCGIAAGLCGMSQNNGWLPINKNLWTPSFIFLLSGFGFFVLSFMYIFIDLKKFWNGAPFIYVGMNPITIYMGHEILGGYFPFSFYINPITHSLYLLSNVIGVSCWLFIAYLMFLNKIFINI